MDAHPSSSSSCPVSCPTGCPQEAVRRGKRVGHGWGSAVLHRSPALLCGLSAIITPRLLGAGHVSGPGEQKFASHTPAPLPPKNQWAERWGVWPRGTSGEKGWPAEEYNPGVTMTGEGSLWEHRGRTLAQPSAGGGQERLPRRGDFWAGSRGTSWHEPGEEAGSGRAGGGHSRSEGRDRAECGGV